MPSLPDNPRTARDLLAFYVEAGVDCALNEDAVDRLSDAAETTAADAALRKPAMPVVSSAVAVAARNDMVAPAPDIATATAREAAAQAKTLDELRALLDAFDGCALKATASRLVFSDGNPEARVMFVGEAPGRDEDIEGRPFVGRSGKLLDLMMGAIGLDRTNVYIANVIPWRPPGNRTPTPQETQICLPFIRRQIELVDPDILVCLGNPSSQTLLNAREGIMKTRGKWVSYDTGTRGIRAVPTFHPAYLLRSPIYKRLAWQDLRAIRAVLHESARAASMP